MKPSAKIIRETINEASTYAFEKRVLSKLEGAGFRCEHSGSYDDQLTKKIREFDIQGHRFSEAAQKAFSHHIAVECKFLSESRPLVILGSTTESKLWPSPVYSAGGNILGILAQYYPNEFVGRSMEQLQATEAKRKNEQVSETKWKLSDADIFGKMSQAISSATAIARDNFTEPYSGYSQTFAEITPVLVVPDGTLWQVKFNNIGEVLNEPVQVNALRYFIGYSCQEHKTRRTDRTVQLEHMTICTYSGLIPALDSSELCDLQQKYYIEPEYSPPNTG